MEWIKIEEYPTYSVSSYGQIRNDKTGRILAQQQNKGYMFIKLTKDKVQHRLSVHRLVAKAFHQNIEDKECVDHRDECKDNNHKDNLRWCTQQENVDFHMELHPEKVAVPITTETVEAKKQRLQVVSDKLSAEYGTTITVDGKIFPSVGQASRYVFSIESTRGKLSTIRKEIQRVAKGKRQPFTMYGRFTIGF